MVPADMDAAVRAGLCFVRRMKWNAEKDKPPAESGGPPKTGIGLSHFSFARFTNCHFSPLF
jgi:hypothetical protein